MTAAFAADPRVTDATRRDRRTASRLVCGPSPTGGRDPFGAETRPPLDPVDAVRLLADAGAYGVNFHDHDLVAIDACAPERDGIVRRFRAALDETGLQVPMATTNLFFDPVFKDGAFTSGDARVRAYAPQKTMRAMDLGADLGAQV